MSRIHYSARLKEHLDNLVKLAIEFQKEDPGKSTEQFKAEAEFIITILKETAEMVD